MITCRKYAEIGPYLSQYCEVRCGRRYYGSGYGWRFYTVNTGHAYIAYSYGTHHPISVAIFNVSISQGMGGTLPDFYFVNSTPYSNTTSRHARLVSSWMPSEVRRMTISCPSPILQEFAAEMLSFNPMQQSLAGRITDLICEIEREKLRDALYDEDIRLEVKYRKIMTRAERQNKKLKNRKLLYA